MKLKNVLIVGTALMFLLSGSMAFAAGAGQDKDGEGYYIHSVTGKTQYFESHPGEPSQWRFIGGPNDGCEGPECSANGNGGISTFAAVGDLSYDGKIVPNGAAGGVGVAGALSAGKADGSFESFEVPVYDYVGRKNGDYDCFFGMCWYKGENRGSYDLTGYKTVTLGSIDLNLDSMAGAASTTDHYVWHPAGRNSIGVGSQTNTYAGSFNRLELSAFGLAEADGMFIGAAGQASADGSIMTKSLNKPWNSNGVTMGLAAQGSAGAYIGGGITGLAGCLVVEGGMDMWGHTRSESYRIKDGDTEILGSNVQANTTVLTSEDVDASLLSVGGIEGGFIAGGIAASKTIQAVNNGVAKASAIGVYTGGGELGCNFNGSAVGYTQTSARPIGTNGAIMTSSAGMKVSTFPQQMPK